QERQADRPVVELEATELRFARAFLGGERKMHRGHRRQRPERRDRLDASEQLVREGSSLLPAGRLVGVYAIGHRLQRRSRTQSGTPASAAGSRAGSLPPAWAISGRPPPFPPTCCATKLTSSPALI